MKRLLGALAIGVFLTKGALASCFNQCVMWNPVNGNCVRTVRVCNPGNPTEMRESFEAGLRAGRLYLSDRVATIDPRIGGALSTVSRPRPRAGNCAAFAVTSALLVGACVFAEMPDACPHGILATVGALKCVQDLTSTEPEREAVIRVLNNQRFAEKLTPALIQEAQAKASRMSDEDWDEIVELSSVETFEKPAYGNSTCESRCLEGVISQKGMCVGAVSVADGREIGCGTMGHPNGRPSLACQCAKPTIKTGNTAGKSCRQYCEGSRYGGFSGMCVAGQVVNGSSLTCDQTARVGLNVSCACLPY